MKMFIDYALLVLGLLVALGWVVANILVASCYSIRFMWEEFWITQTIFGKLCANVFYAPAWVLQWVKFALVVALFWVCTPIYKGLRAFVRWLKPLYEDAKGLNL